MKKYLSVVFLFLIFLACFLASSQPVKVMKQTLSNQKEDKKQITVVIDPGHGGRDPGKVGVNNALEKEINLSIAFKLKNLLELNDIKVIMTRDSDIGLYNEDDPSKKRADLKNRIDIIDSNKVDFAISIHQNSFSEEYCKGAQVFYYDKSKDGKQLAELIQAQLKETMADGNHRQAKPNNSYYMLTKTQRPLVIVECGYLSNCNEADLLTDEDYQEKMAWGIHLAILRYINDSGFNSVKR